MAGFATKISTTDYSQTIGTTAVTIYPTITLAGLHYIRVWNVAPTGGGTVWLSRSGAAEANAPGSFPLTPGQYEIFSLPQAIPVNGLSAVSDSANTPLTVEVG